MPARAPPSISVKLVGPLPADLNTGDRLALLQNRLNNLFDLVRDLRNGLTHRSPNMIGNRNSADFGQPLVYL